MRDDDDRLVTGEAEGDFLDHAVDDRIISPVGGAIAKRQDCERGIDLFRAGRTLGARQNITTLGNCLQKAIGAEHLAQFADALSE